MGKRKLVEAPSGTIAYNDGPNKPVTLRFPDGTFGVYQYYEVFGRPRVDPRMRAFRRKIREVRNA